MSKRNRGQRATARRNALVAARAELAILLEDRLQPHHMQLNLRDTREELLFAKEYNEPRPTLQPVKGGWVTTTRWDDEIDAFTYYGAGLDKMIKPST